MAARQTTRLRCCECAAITAFSSSENWSANRRKCSGCGSLFLEPAPKDEAAPQPLRRIRRPRPPVPADVRSERKLAWLKRQREDFLARKKHGLLKHELRRP